MNMRLNALPMEAEALISWQQGRITALETQLAELEKERDAIASDADRAHQLLREAENEMRYADWGTYQNDNFARFEIYNSIEEFLK